MFLKFTHNNQKDIKNSDENKLDDSQKKQNQQTDLVKAAVFFDNYLVPIEAISTKESRGPSLPSSPRRTPSGKSNSRS